MRKKICNSVVTIILWVAHISGVLYVLKAHDDDRLTFAIMIVLLLGVNFVFCAIWRAIWDI